MLKRISQGMLQPIKERMKLASAQINCTVGEIQQNLDKHYQMINIAIAHKAQLILFPEMSITGYCREEGEKFAFTESDSRLKKLQELSALGNIIIIAGAPIKIKEKLYINFQFPFLIIVRYR